MNFFGTISDMQVFIFAVFLLSHYAKAGLVKRSSRTTREVYPPEIESNNDANHPQACIVGDVVYGLDEAVPSEQPCLKCRCVPPQVQCETVQCAKTPGCKAVHRPNKCCPDYQCECEHDGKIYSNGEKLETNPGSECKVCYCRGGVVQCAEVSCYIRTDCEGKRVTGQCCPKYDHCPLIDTLSEKRSLSTESPLTTPKSNFETWQDPLVSNLTQVTTSNTQDENKILDTNSAVTLNPEEMSEQEEPLPKITIQEIIPERKEIPITTPPKSLTQSQGTLLIEDVTEINDSGVYDSASEPSDIAEVYQHPPPILRIGDKLLFLKKGQFVPENDENGPSPVITIIGAEGLQRGFEESGEIQYVKANENDKNVSRANDDLEHQSSVVSSTISTAYKEKNCSQTAPMTTSEIASLPKNCDTANEQNPAYPPIPDAMPAQKFEVDTENDDDAVAKILPDVLNLLSNATVVKNVSHSDWLKYINTHFRIAPTDANQNSTEKDETLSATKESKSVESLELEESGEQTTPKNRHSTTVLTGDISLESDRNDKTEANDMTIIEPDLTGSETLSSTNRPISTDVELTNALMFDTQMKERNENSLKNEVELINVDTLMKPTKTSKIESSTYEFLPTPEQAYLKESPDNHDAHIL